MFDTASVIATNFLIFLQLEIEQLTEMMSFQITHLDSNEAILCQKVSFFQIEGNCK